MIIPKRKETVCSSEEVAKVMRAFLETEDRIGQEREHFWSIGLNTKNVIQYAELVSLGSLSASIVHPREAFRLAVSKGVAAIVFAHNHPSGDTKPSQEDILITRRLVGSGEVLGIKVLDHVILGENTHFSFRDNGMISSQ